MIRKSGAYLLAVAIAYVLAAVASTQSVLANLARMGLRIAPGERLDAILHDLGGMASSFLPLIALALLIAFLVAGLITRWLPRWRIPLYIAAGAVAVVGLHLILKASFDITPVAAARSAYGLFLQAAAGAVGGYVFVRVAELTRRTA